MHCSDEISKRNKSRRVKKCSGDNLYNFYLCKECSNFLNSNINSKKIKSSSNAWPALILTTLTYNKIFKIYENKIWQLIPLRLQYWWVDTLPTHFPEFNNNSIYELPLILVDRTSDLSEWNELTSSAK